MDRRSAFLTGRHLVTDSGTQQVEQVNLAPDRAADPSFAAIGRCQLGAAAERGLAFPLLGDFFPVKGFVRSGLRGVQNWPAASSHRFACTGAGATAPTPVKPTATIKRAAIALVILGFSLEYSRVVAVGE